MKRLDALGCARMALAASFAIGAASASAAEDLKIGTVLSFSQVMGVYGNAILDGMNFAIEEAGGAVAGRRMNHPLRTRRHAKKERGFDFAQLGVLRGSSWLRLLTADC